MLLNNKQRKITMIKFLKTSLKRKTQKKYNKTLTQSNKLILLLNILRVIKLILKN